MSGLLRGDKTSCNNLLELKTHGGITGQDIEEIVEKAIDTARKNKPIKTILFFDEANTSDGIGVIKSVMCDRLLRGVPIPDDCGLKVSLSFITIFMSYSI